MFKVLMKETIINLKMICLMIKYNIATAKRYKIGLQMVDAYEKYSDCKFIMHETNERYREMFEKICILKGEMSVGRS